ncbi:MAG: hypothetical protein ACPG06_05170 [Alphaproteobacteria bacterium]
MMKHRSLIMAGLIAASMTITSVGLAQTRADVPDDDGATQGQTKEHILLKDGSKPDPRSAFVKMKGVKGESTATAPEENDGARNTGGPKEKFPPTKQSSVTTPTKGEAPDRPRPDPKPKPKPKPEPKPGGGHTGPDKPAPIPVDPGPKPAEPGNTTLKGAPPAGGEGTFEFDSGFKTKPAPQSGPKRIVKVGGGDTGYKCFGEQQWNGQTLPPECVCDGVADCLKLSKSGKCKGDVSLESPDDPSSGKCAWDE